MSCIRWDTDSFGLPAEQYAIQTGTHPAKTTVKNIDTFRRQMDNIGFSFDWEREVRTSDPSYYKWTQWIFLQLFDAWYCNNADAARPISRLVEEFKANGNKDVNAHCDETPLFLPMNGTAGMKPSSRPFCSITESLI